MTLKGIDDGEKRGAVKIRIASADSTDPVLTHENGCMGIMQEIAGKARKFSDDLLGQLSVALHGGENIDFRRGALFLLFRL